MYTGRRARSQLISYLAHIRIRLCSSSGTVATICGATFDLPTVLPVGKFHV